MRRRRPTWLAVAALALALGTLPTLAPKAEDAPESEARAARGEVAREFGEPPQADAPTGSEQDEHADLRDEHADLREEWNAERNELLAEQGRAAAELAALKELNADLQNDRQVRWMLVGGGLVLAGLVLGVLIKSRPARRDAWQ